MKRRILHILLLAASLSSAGQLHHACPFHTLAESDYENPLYDRWLSAYDITYYDITLSVSNASTDISGSVAIVLKVISEMDTLVLELQDALTVSSVYLQDDMHSEEFTYQTGYVHEGDVLYIVLDRPREAPDSFKVLVNYEGDAGSDRGFFAGVSNVRDARYGFDVTYTLSEPLNAKDWLPVKQVLEDKIDSVRMKLICDTALMAASNGLLTSLEEEGSDRIFTWETRYPMAYYLISFAVADYRDYSFYADLPAVIDSVLVQNYLYDTDDVLGDWEEEILHTGNMITALSGLLSVYPFALEKYGHAMAPLGGGMEHQTMTTIQDFGFYLVAHELAHQWFGNYVTCGNWQDIWINEGFASYMEYVTAQELRGQEAADGWMTHAMSVALNETEGSVFVPSSRAGDPYRVFDYGLSYKKGAILLHMIRYILDDDALFFSILRRYLDQYRDGVATGEDFRTVLEQESGTDFSCFFDQWYYGEGFPRFTLQWYQQRDSLKILSEQFTSAPSVTPFFRTPFDLEIGYSDGAVETVRLLQDQPSQQYTVAARDVLVDYLLFDPDDRILNTADVIRQVPEARNFTYGPNPVTGELYIRFTNADRIDEILLTSMSGREMMRLADETNPVFIDMSGMADGAYLLVLTENDRTYKERIVKVSGSR